MSQHSGELAVSGTEWGDPHYGGTAALSPDGLYRYELTRRWRWDGTGQVCWVMLNPSTANALEDDPTIRRCVGFSQRFGFDSLVVVNLYAYRATDPKALLAAGDAIGPDNEAHVRKAVEESAVVIAAWGAWKKANPLRLGFHFGWPTPATRKPVYCLGQTKNAAPKHPLYLPSDAVMEPWGSWQRNDRFVS